MSHSASPTLQDLPSELLAEVVSHLNTAQSLRHLSLSSKRLDNYIRNDGYRVFVQHRFPSIPTPPYWKDAAHALTSLSRAWDRKALVAQYIKPGTPQARNPGHGLPTAPRRQTMGYQPVIDSFEDWIGNDWASRKEVLAWGAGSDLIMRLKWKGESSEKRWQEASRHQRHPLGFDGHHHYFRWPVIKESGLVDGKDDITSLNLLRDQQKVSQSEYAIVGRANGSLDTLSISNSEVGVAWRRETRFNTDKRPIKSASVNSSPSPLLAACLADEKVAFFPVIFKSGVTEPLGEISITRLTPGARIWSTKFLKHDLLALGLGPCAYPVQIFSVRPDSVSETPLRKFLVGSDFSETIAPSHPRTVYPIAPLAPSLVTGGCEGDMFLSGGYDGTVRLHDLRSPASFTAVFTDLVDTHSSIYSLLPIGRERFIAGGGNYSLLKVFDLRMPGGKMYHAADLDPCTLNYSQKASMTTQSKASPVCCEYHHRKHQPSNWNIFLSGPALTDSRVSSARRKPNSPVYSLSSPSSCSPTLFAGVENNVIQIDIASVHDPFPDPVFEHKSKYSRHPATDTKHKWYSTNEALSLAMYEQVSGSPKLKCQVPLGAARRMMKGWDDRWIDV